MRRLGLAKKALLLALCAALAVPATGLGWTPMTVEAKETLTLEEVQKSVCQQIEDHYIGILDSIPKDKQEEAAKVKDSEKEKVMKMGSIEGVQGYLETAKGRLNEFLPSEEPAPEQPQEEPKPSTTNSNIMIGGNWVTPTANAGQYVNVVLPVVNMGRTWVDHVVVTPQISQDAATWPFEIETSNYSQTIEGLPGTDDGGSDMDRRRELTWTLKTRKDAPSGYVPINFNVSYEDENNTLTSVTLTSYVKVVGTAGVSADGKASTPRVIVTGFSTDPETVHAGETFTLTLHMQNTSQATAVKNMVFDIQAASESTDTTYVAAAFLPTAGSSTIFVDQIAPGATKDISMEMEARADLAQKPYVVNVNSQRVYSGASGGQNRHQQH